MTSRFVSLSLEGFRAFTEAQTFDLDADAIVIHGSNGQGKTSFFDALLWALVGEVPRLNAEPSAVVSRYAKAGIARVELHLRDSDGHAHRIVRSQDMSGEQRVSFDDSVGMSGEVALKRWLITASIGSDDTLESALTRAIYLQQDLVRQFIDSDRPADRFALLGTLLGIGQISALQAQLEQERNRWTRASRGLEDEVEELRGRLAEHRVRLADFQSATGAELTADQLRNWWTEFTRHRDTDEQIQVGDAAMSQLASALNSLRETAVGYPTALRAISTLRSSLRRLAELRVDGGASAQERVDRAELAVEELRQESARVSAVATELRAALQASEEERRALTSLAELALRFLDERCPVCNQVFDRIETESRLRARLETENPLERRLRSVGAELAETTSRLSGAESELTEARVLLSGMRDEEESLRGAIADLTERLVALQATGVVPSAGLESEVALGELAARLNARAEESARLIAAGDELMERFQRLSTTQRLQRWVSEIDGLEAELRKKEIESRRRTSVRSLASSILDALREANITVVRRRLDELTPLLAALYASVDPHPSLRVARFMASLSRGHGQLYTPVADTGRSFELQSPSAFLSSSQTNALAVSVFLSLNLGLSDLPIEAVLLDDPLLSLDDVNLLGLVDLVRKVRGRRQLLISTHDSSFAELLQRKLRPTGAGSRTVMLSFREWNREGPVVEIVTDVGANEPLRIAGSAA